MESKRKPTTRLIRLAEVKRQTGMSTSTIYRWMAAGSFPRSYSLGPRIVAWSQTEIEAWISKALDRDFQSAETDQETL